MSKISVIIPVYNVEKYFRECLKNVVNQILKDKLKLLQENIYDTSLENLKKILGGFNE